jgi:hypothetical protein
MVKPVWLLVLGLGACGRQPAPVIGGISPEVVCGSGTLPLAVNGQYFLAQPVNTLAGGVALEVPSAQLIPASGSILFPEVTWYSTELLSLKVSLDQLTPGSYALALQDPDGQGARADTALTKVEVPPVIVTSVSPAALCVAQADTSITVAGSGFLAGASVSIRDGSGAVVLRPDPSVTDTSISLTLAEAAIAPGNYTLVVENPPMDGCVATAATPLVIDPPPSLIKVISGAVCQTGGQITIQGANLLLGATVQIEVGGVSLAATNIDTSAGDQAIVTFPANMLPHNSQADLNWLNPDGCNDVLMKGVHVRPGMGGCN